MAEVFTLNYLANQNYCITAVSASAGASLLLNYRGGQLGSSMQLFGYDGQYIYLKSNPSLVIDIQGTSPSNGVQLILNLKDSSRVTQQWSMTSNPPYIMNVGAAGFCIDNDSGRQQAGNKVQLWTQIQNNTNQQWTPASIPSFLL